MTNHLAGSGSRAAVGPAASRHCVAFQRSPAWLFRFFLLCVAGVLCSSAAGQDSSSRQTPKAIATIDGESIFEDQLPGPVRTQLQKIHQQEDSLKSRGLDALLEQKLIEAEAKKSGVTVTQLIAAQVDAKVADPTADELNVYYLARRDQLNEPLDEVREQLLKALKASRAPQARQNYVKGLLERAKASGEVVVLLRPTRIEVNFDAARLKGSPHAPVMIVEFSDFSCPYCRQAEGTLQEIVSKYQGKVSQAYRDYPMREAHPHAEMAAEASRCAAEQGRFWEYHDLLFANPEKQDRDDLLPDARVLELDEKRFDSCLSSGRYKPQIDQDLKDGIRTGVVGTPGFFVNGIFVGGAQPAAVFEQIIDEELSRNQRISSK
jgi:protein-disulfide isomerase